MLSESYPSDVGLAWSLVSPASWPVTVTPPSLSTRGSRAERLRSCAATPREVAEMLSEPYPSDVGLAWT